MSKTTTGNPLPTPPSDATTTSMPNPEAPAKITLETAILEARGTIGSALRMMIAAAVPETDLNRLKLENVFEAVRAEIAKGKFTTATLTAAVSAATVAVTLLANNSRTEGDKLQAFRGDAGRLAKLAAALAPQE